MIVGTAGHIDHGKTTLVHALTGVDTDRLPEEKRRGISIELGYAYLRTPDGGSIGFVDVPGHERLLHTMLAGATGVDHALLLVAADDGVMPQTREHLAVLSLLAIERGTVAITKIDRVDAARVDAVRRQVAELVAGTPLAAAPVLAVSAHSGAGVAALRERLFEAAHARPDGADELPRAFRLAVDRSFTLAGVGTVVTGSVHAGAVAVGDELLVVPGGRPVRVRSLHAQNQPAGGAHAGQRCALALHGASRDEVARGDWLCAPHAVSASARLDAELRWWPGEATSLRSGLTVHVHLGAGDEMGTLALLDRDTLRPGETGLVQVVLRRPVGAWHGDRGVLRDASAQRTLAGLRVLDPQAPARYRRTPERLALLRAWQAAPLADRLAGVVAASPHGVDAAAVARSLGHAGAALELPWPQDALRLPDAQAPAVVGAAAWQAIRDAVTGALAELHKSRPDEIGADPRRLKRIAGGRIAERVWREAVATLLADGALAQSGAWLHLPEHGRRLSAAEQRVAEALLPPLLEGGHDPPWVRDLARSSGTAEALVRQTLAHMAQRGEVFQVVKDLYYPAATVERLARLAREVATGEAGLSAAAFRDAAGLGRKRAIQILEFFDRIGYTRRVGDRHLLRPDTMLFGPS